MIPQNIERPESAISCDRHLPANIRLTPVPLRTAILRPFPAASCSGRFKLRHHLNTELV